MRISDWSSDVCSSDLEILMPDAEYSLQRIAQVHAYQRRRRRIEIAFDHRQMHGIVDRVLIGHEAEIAELGADVRLGDALDGVLVVESITNQIGDRAELETVLARELFQIRTTCHRAVLVEDLDDHGRRLDARSEEHTSELQSLMRN